MHFHDLLAAQKPNFLPGDIRPLAPVPRGRKALEAHLRAVECAEREAVEAAIAGYIEHGAWPVGLTAPQQMFLALRLEVACGVAMRLSVPMPKVVECLPVPTVAEDILFSWLLITQWEAWGREDWIAEVLSLLPRARHGSGRPGDSSPGGSAPRGPSPN